MCLFSLNRSLVSVCPPYLHTSISFKPGFAIIPVKPSDQQEQIRRLNLLCPERAGGREGENRGRICGRRKESELQRKRWRKGCQEVKAPFSWYKADIVNVAENIWWRFPIASKASWWSDSERFLLVFLRDKLWVLTAAWPASSEKQNQHPSESLILRQRFFFFWTFGKAFSLLCTMRGTMEAQRESHAEIWSC